MKCIRNEKFCKYLESWGSNGWQCFAYMDELHKHMPTALRETGIFPHNTPIQCLRCEKNDKFSERE